MSDYSYEDLQSMQQKAMARVSAMKKRADALINGENEESKLEQREIPIQQKPIYETKITSMKADIPKKREYEDFKSYFDNGKSKNTPANKTTKTKLSGILQEKDKLLLLGIIDILKSQNADNKLILSLMYILS